MVYKEFPEKHDVKYMEYLPGYIVSEVNGEVMSYKRISQIEKVIASYKQ